MFIRRADVYISDAVERGALGWTNTFAAIRIPADGTLWSGSASVRRS
jgi:hypothetical protein